ncbi:hypothetical protein NSQ54_10615 [Alkalihalobacillus sp. FSL W8-0930]
MIFQRRFMISVIVLVLLSVLNTNLVHANTLSNSYFNDALDEDIQKRTNEINEQWEIFWTKNLKSYIRQDIKKKEVREKLDELEEYLLEEIESIKAEDIPEELDRKDKRSIKKIHKAELKNYRNLLKQTRKVDKDIKRDKFVDSEQYDKKLKTSQKNEERINKEIEKINSKNDVSIKTISFNLSDEIDKETVLNELEEEIKLEKEAQEKAAALAEEERNAQGEENSKELIEASSTDTNQKEIEFQNWVNDLIVTGEGLIVDVKPFMPDDWSNTDIYLSSEYFLLTPEQQKYLAETIGPTVKNQVLAANLESYTSIRFRYYEDNRVLAEEKFWGSGYNMK